MIKALTFQNINALVYIPDSACGLVTGDGLTSVERDGMQEGLPLMVYLHGIGEKGDTIPELEKLKKLPPLSIAEKEKFPFIIFAPQLKKNYGSWPVKYVHNAIKFALDTYKANPKQVWLAGISLGGGAVWGYAQTLTIPYVSKGVTTNESVVPLAAIVPICGYQNSPSKAVNIKMPVYAFHGMADTTINISVTMRMLTALEKLGRKPLHTFYPAIGHSCWGKAFSTDHSCQTPNIYEWLQQQILK